MKFSAKVHEILLKRNITQEELAKRMGITSSALSQILNNPQRTIRSKHRIAKALDFPLEDLCESIGDKIKGYMRERRLTQKVLARKLGITQSSLSVMLSGNITYKNLTRIAYSLNCNVEDLITEDGEDVHDLPRKVSSWNPYDYHSNYSYN